MNSNGSNNSAKVWGIAALAAILAFFALKFLAEYTTLPALLLAILIGGLVAILLWIGFYKEDEGAETSSGAALHSSTSASTSRPTEGEAAAAVQTPPESPSATATTASMSTGDAEPAQKSDAVTKAATKPAKATAKKKAPAKAKAAPTKATAKPAAKTAPARKPVAKDGKPATLKKARSTGADDLKQLKGVGPGLEKTLNELGFWHFDQIGGWRKKEIEWVDERLKFKGRIERDEWVKQAKVLAKGGTTDFSKRVKKGGVY